MKVNTFVSKIEYAISRENNELLPNLAYRMENLAISFPWGCSNFQFLKIVEEKNQINGY